MLLLSVWGLTRGFFGGGDKEILVAKSGPGFLVTFCSRVATYIVNPETRPGGRGHGKPGMESDAEIVQRVVEGDVEAFELLLRRHAARVFEIVGRRVPPAEVSAVAQDVFLGAFRSLASYSRRQPFEHWLLRIARRRCYDYWRSRSRQGRHRAEPLDGNERDWLEQVTAGPVREQYREEAGREEAGRVVRKALEALGVEDRAMMEAVYFEEVPLKEVAAGFGWSLAKTKMRALRARRALRGILERWRMGGEAPA